MNVSGCVNIGVVSVLWCVHNRVWMYWIVSVLWCVLNRVLKVLDCVLYCGVSLIWIEFIGVCPYWGVSV